MVQRFPEKALVLQDESLSKGTCPALISTRPFSNQFILKESQNIFLPSSFGRSIKAHFSVWYKLQSKMKFYLPSRSINFPKYCWSAGYFR